MRQGIYTFFKFCFKFGVVFLLFVFCYLLYIFSDLNRDINQEKLSEIIQSVSQSKAQEDRIIDMYNSIYDDALAKSTVNYLFHIVADSERPSNPCYLIASRSYLSNNRGLSENDYVITHHIEKEVGRRKCLDCLFAMYNFGYRAIGIGEAARIYFEKEVSDLSEEEIIGIFAMMENSSYYNPKRWPNVFKDKVAELKARRNKWIRN